MEPIEHVFQSGQSMAEAKEILKTVKGDSFVVWSRPGIPIGYITRESIENFGLGQYTDNPIDAWVIPSPAVVAPETSAGQLFTFMQQYKIPLALVFDQVNYRGIVYWNKVAEGSGNIQW